MVGGETSVKKSKITDQKSKLRNPPKADDFLNFSFYTLHFNFSMKGDKMHAILMKIFLSVIRNATPDLIRMLRDAVLELDKKAKETPNPWDDILCEVLKGITSAGS